MIQGPGRSLRFKAFRSHARDQLRSHTFQELMGIGLHMNALQRWSAQNKTFEKLSLK
jgi:hypothetical protein